MVTKYLLPCTCGKKIPVESRQAGEEILCDCGQRLTAPTMLSMRNLEPVPTEPGSSETINGGGLKPWGARQRVMLVGCIALLGFVAWASVLFRDRPVPPVPEIDRETIAEQVERFTPDLAWRAWHRLRARGLDRSAIDRVTAYEEQALQYHTWLTVAACGALVGLGLIVIPLLIRRPDATRSD